jgi:hypothetical protein
VRTILALDISVSKERAYPAVLRHLGRNAASVGAKAGGRTAGI